MVPKSVVPIFFSCMVQFKAWFNAKWDFTFLTHVRGQFSGYSYSIKTLFLYCFLPKLHTLHSLLPLLVDSFPIRDGKCLPSRWILSSSTTCDLGLDTFIVHESFEDSISFSASISINLL